MKTDRISRFIIDQVSLYDIEIKTEILILFLNSSIFIILEKFEIKTKTYFCRSQKSIQPNWICIRDLLRQNMVLRITQLFKYQILSSTPLPSHYWNEIICINEKKSEEDPKNNSKLQSTISWSINTYEETDASIWQCSR